MPFVGDGVKMTESSNYEKKFKGIDGVADEMEEKWRDSSRFSEDFGICNDCSHFYATETKFSKVYARCTEIEKRLDPRDPIVKCSWYRKRGMLSIYDMKEMATPIDIRRQAGFINTEDDE